MRHLKAGRKFGRNTSHRRAMFRNLTANLLTHERIETTDAKAKEVRRVAERLLTKAIRLGDVAFTPLEQLSGEDRARRLHAQRLVGAYIPRFAVRTENGESKKIDLVEKVFVELAKRYQGRPGGYTRIVKLGARRGDNADMSLIELVGNSVAPKGSGRATGAAEAATAAEPAEGGVSVSAAE